MLSLDLALGLEWPLHVLPRQTDRRRGPQPGRQCLRGRSLAGCRQRKSPPAASRVALAEPIRIGHKIALRPIAPGEPVIKYGQTIGFATAAIAPGGWVHSHNLAAGQFARDYATSTAIPADPTAADRQNVFGLSPRRPPGRHANYIAVISTVNCSASVSRYVARRFDREMLKRDFPHIDGVVAFTHGGGCGMPFKGLNHQVLNRVMAGIARHPNIGGYLLIGLGCETATIGSLLEEHNLVQIGGLSGQRVGQRVPADEAASLRPLVLSMQDQGGTQKTIDAAVHMVGEMLPRVNDVRRQPIPASQLILGTNCGGSDGNSGVTANPALGVASDLLVAAGGTVVLGETTEIYGAEQLLTRRARTPAVADKLIERIGWWEWYTGLFGATPDNNPSPGNKEGGLTTIYEKSLGAVAKGGSTALAEVYQYAEEVTAPGLVVMDTPGLDAPSVTGIVAGGAPGDGLYDRPRQLFWLEADAHDQSGQQHADVPANDRRHGHRRRHDSGRPAGRRSRPRNLRPGLGRRQRRADQERGDESGRRRIRPLERRANAVARAAGVSPGPFPLIVSCSVFAGHSQRQTGFRAAVSCGDGCVESSQSPESIVTPYQYCSFLKWCSRWFTHSRL